MLRRHKPMMRSKPLRGAPPAKADMRSRACDRLWSLLREDGVGGLPFRKGERLGPFTVDFLCPAARQVVLVEDEATTGEAACWLRENGYRVLEFPAGEVLNNPRHILDAITQSFELRIVPRKS